MSRGPLLYYVLKNLLDKGTPIDAHFVVHRYGSRPVRGMIQGVHLNDDFDMVIYVRHRSELEFQTLDHHDADKLDLYQAPNGAWALVNLRDEKEVTEGIVASEDDEPLLIALLRRIRARGEPIYIGLGSLRYYLQSIEFAPPNDFLKGDFWALTFSETPQTHATVRRINAETADNWVLEKEVTSSGEVRWRMAEKPSMQNGDGWNLQ